MEKEKETHGEKGKDMDSSLDFNHAVQAREHQKECRKEKEAKEQCSTGLVTSVERLGTRPRDAQSWEKGSKGIATGAESRGTPKGNALKGMGKERE